MAGLDSFDQHVEVVERGAQVDEGGVGLAKRARQQIEGASEGHVLVGDRIRRGARVGHEAGEVVAALGDRPHRGRGVLDEAREQRIVERELTGQVGGRDEEGSDVLGALGGLLGTPGIPIGLAADEVAQSLAGIRVERVEQDVEVDRRGGVVRLDPTAVVDLLGVVGPGLDRDIAVGDCRQRGRANGRLGARVQGRELLVDLHRDNRLGAIVELDDRDRPDRRAADADLSARDQLARVLEDRLDLVGLAVAEHGERDQRHGGDERRHGDHARYGRAAFVGDRLPKPGSSLWRPLIFERFASPVLSSFS